MPKSRKLSRKGSRKVLRKGSRKMSRKMSRKISRKGSRKISRKGSRVSRRKIKFSPRQDININHFKMNNRNQQTKPSHQRTHALYLGRDMDLVNMDYAEDSEVEWHLYDPSIDDTILEFFDIPKVNQRTISIKGIETDEDSDDPRFNGMPKLYMFMSRSTNSNVYRGVGVVALDEDSARNYAMKILKSLEKMQRQEVGNNIPLFENFDPDFDSYAVLNFKDLVNSVDNTNRDDISINNTKLPYNLINQDWNEDEE